MRVHCELPPQTVHVYGDAADYISRNAGTETRFPPTPLDHAGGFKNKSCTI